ncbi:MAG: sodium-dependent bicarbonate transport family permease [Rickettsiales bacterium]|nr:sodium-dependent bicarbonate transport family permease [Rickettsiales bacterium]
MNINERKIKIFYMTNHMLFLDNLLSPSILFFLVGILTGLLKVDLEIPKSISKFLAIYLMISIGFKGGVSINALETINFKVFYSCMVAMLVSFTLPFLAYRLLEKNKNLDKYTAAAIAANSGSISIVTFVAATSILGQYNISYEGYIVTIVALMEFPAIISGFLLANKNKEINSKQISFKHILSNHTIFLLLSSFLIGCITGTKGLSKIEGFISAPFQGLLSIFLLDMGIIISKELEELKKINIKLIVFGIYMPLIGATIGLLLSKLLNFDFGTTILFTTLCASSSYIAVPAAMKSCVPQAKASIYMPMSLAITFPFNIILGIPIYVMIAKFMN